MLPCVLPVGFVSPGAVLTWLYIASLAGCAASTLVLVPRLPIAVRITLILLIILFLCSAAQGYLVSPLLLIGQYCVGCVLASAIGSRLKGVLWSYLAFVIASLSVDWFTKRHDALAFFPRTYVDLDVDANSFRASGFIGQPVPAAFIAVSVCVYLWIAAQRVPLLAHVAVLAAGAWALYTTGTRSALVTVALVSMWGAAVRVVHGEWLPRSWGRSLAMICVASIAVLGIGLRGGGELTRVLDFGSLSGSQSLAVRSGALDIVRTLPNVCGLPCDVAGHGLGALQAALRAGSAIDGVTTVDNQYISMYWDGGMAGLVLLAVLVYGAARLTLAAAPTARAAGFAALVLLVGGLFVSDLSINIMVITMGLFLSARDGDPVGADAQVRSVTLNCRSSSPA